MPLPPILRRHGPNLALIVLAVALGHGPALRAPFVWDDYETVVQNRQMQAPGQLLRYFDLDHWRQSHPALHSPYRPVREVLLGAVRQVAGPDPRAFHAVLLAGHAANALLLYAVAGLLLDSRVGGLAAALLFALHPAHVEVVAWTKNVGEVVCVFFALAALVAFLRWGRSTENHQDRGAWAWAAGGIAAFGLALLAKESAAPLPLVALAWAMLVFRGRQRWRMALATAPLWVMAAAYAALQLASRELTSRAATAQWTVPTAAWPRLFLVLKTVVHYLGVLVLPLWHSPWRDFRVIGGEPTVEQAGVVLAVAAVGSAFVWLARRQPAAALGLFWTVAALGPASNVVVNVGRPFAEQRLYLPSAGFALLLASLAAPLLVHRRRRPAAQALLAVLCVAYAAVQVHALGDWRTERRLWLRSARFSPQHGGSHCNLGDAYTTFGAYANAEAQFRKVVELKRDYPDGLMNLGGVLRRMNRFDDAMRALEEAEALFPGTPGVLNNMGNVCYRRSERLREAGDAEGARRWLDEAIRRYTRAAEASPWMPQAYANLGICHTDAGDHDRALAMFRKALDLYPEFAEAHYNLGRLYLRLEKPREALDHYQRAARINPAIQGIWAELAALHEALDEWVKAEACWREAVERDRRSGAPPAALLDKLAGLALAQERLGRPREARQTWGEARRLAPGHPVIEEGLRRAASAGGAP